MLSEIPLKGDPLSSGIALGRVCFYLSMNLTVRISAPSGDDQSDDNLYTVEVFVSAVPELAFPTTRGWIAFEIDNHWQEITNYFLERHSSGFVERLNNKLKVLKCRCYGLDSVRTLLQRLWLDLEGYRAFGKA